MINKFLKILTSRFSLVLSVVASIAALIIIGLLPMAVESIIHDIKGIASKQQYFTEDLVDTGQHFTDMELLIKQIDELGQVATIEISGERSCVSPCGSFTDKVTFFGINEQTKERRTHSKNVSITIPDENTFISGEIKLPFTGRLFRYPYDAYTLGIGVSVERTFKDQPPRLLTQDEIAKSFELSFSESISRMELKSFKKVDGTDYKPRNVHAPYIIAGIAEFERPTHLKIRG